MSKTLKLYFAMLLIILGIIFYLDMTQPRVIDWTETYSTKDKIPFGLFVFDNEIKTIFKNDSIEKYNKTIYEYFNGDYIVDEDAAFDEYKNIDTVQYNQDSLSVDSDSASAVVDSLVQEDYTDSYEGTIISISNYIDAQSANQLLKFVSKGNSVFISDTEFDKVLQDSLKFKMEYEMQIEDTLQVWSANKKYNNPKFKFEKGASYHYFSSIDTLKTTVLGYQGDGKNKEVNFIKVPFKKGYFYFHTQPAAFSNYYLLKQNYANYASSILGLFPHKSVLWFIKNQDGVEISSSPARYITSKPALKWAWYFALLFLVVFIIFNAKRRQRVVPIKKPLPNTTVDFTKTIGNLYYQEGNHQNIITKKIIYFLEKVRSDFMLDTKVLDDKFVQKLVLKSGKNKDDVEKVIRLIKQNQNSNIMPNKNDLLELNSAIEKIF